MTESHTTLLEASRQIAADFLQSVVVIDDRAEYGESNGSEGPSLSPHVQAPHSIERSRSRRPRRILNPPAPGSGGVAGLPEGREHELNAKELVDGFAAVGLVCAVLKPGMEEDARRTTLPVARRADIVVLDWDLHQDAGTTTLGLLDGIVASDAGNDGRMRLIAIYTGERNLRDVARQLRSRLARYYTTHRPRQLDAFTTSKGPVRVVVFAKPGTKILARDRAGQARIVPAQDLPDRLINEFAQLTAGLVSNVALDALAALRGNTHKILRKLNRDLDPAYLWHRAMQPRPADAENHLVSLVAAEIRAILDDAEVGNCADITAIGHWLEREGANVDYGQRFGETSPPLTLDDVKQLLEYGVEGNGPNVEAVKQKFSSLKKTPRKKRIACFAPSVAEATRSNEALAVLMSLKTQYAHPRPILSLGTILCTGRGNTKRYWLCMQPRCDSVRIESARSFPLLPLTPRADDEDFHIILPAGRGKYLKLRVSKRPADLRMVSFPNSGAESDTVQAEHMNGNGTGFRFRSSDKRWYQWVGELKTDQAHRMAHMLAAQFSRIGLTESEWLRRWAPERTGH